MSKAFQIISGRQWEGRHAENEYFFFAVYPDVSDVWLKTLELFPRLITLCSRTLVEKEVHFEFGIFTSQHGIPSWQFVVPLAYARRYWS